MSDTLDRTRTCAAAGCERRTAVPGRALAYLLDGLCREHQIEVGRFSHWLRGTGVYASRPSRAFDAERAGLPLL